MITRIDQFRRMLNDSIHYNDMDPVKVLDIGGHTIYKFRSYETESGKFSEYDIEKSGYKRGWMFTVHESPEGWVVRNAFVPEVLQKSGIGTAFYKKMNELSLKDTKMPLRSTPARKLSNGQDVHELSDDGIKLWDSLVAKGYAVKRGHKDYVFL